MDDDISCASGIEKLTQLWEGVFSVDNKRDSTGFDTLFEEPIKGPFINYVDRILRIFDPLRRQVYNKAYVVESLKQNK